MNNVFNAFKEIDEFWSPKIIASVNSVYVKVAKLQGDCVWHTHEHEDEFFYVVKGQLTINLPDDQVLLEEGGYFVVPKGTCHQPVAQEPCWIMLVENKETKHTGDTISAMTKSIEDQF